MMRFFMGRDLEERLSRVEASKERGERELETLRQRKEVWKPVTARKATGSYISTFEGEKPKTLRESFLWDHDRATTEEEQYEVFKHYVDKMTFSRERGFTKETAGKRLMSWLAKRDKEEVS